MILVYRYLIVLTSLAGKIILSHWIVLAPCQIQLTMNWGLRQFLLEYSWSTMPCQPQGHRKVNWKFYFLILNSILLNSSLCKYYTILIPVAWSHVLKSKSVSSPTLFFVFKIILDILSLLNFLNFRINLSISTKKRTEIFIETELNPWASLGLTAILTMLSSSPSTEMIFHS